MKDSVIPLLSSLKNKAEKMEITIGVIDCDDANDVVIHKCLAKVRFDNQVDL